VRHKGEKCILQCMFKSVQKLPALWSVAVCHGPAIQTMSQIVCVVCPHGEAVHHLWRAVQSVRVELWEQVEHRGKKEKEAKALAVALVQEQHKLQQLRDALSAVERASSDASGVSGFSLPLHRCVVIFGPST
jgi:hypothetical protein